MFNKLNIKYLEMALNIKQKKDIDGIKDFFKDYLKSYRKINDEKIINETLEKYQIRLTENNSILFVAYLDEYPIGIISGRQASEKVFEVNTFYILKKGYNLNCGSQLVKNIANFAFLIEKALAFLYSVSRQRFFAIRYTPCAIRALSSPCSQKHYVAQCISVFCFHPPFIKINILGNLCNC